MIQRDLARALDKGSQSYNALCPLSPAAKEELDWWMNQLTRWNGKGLVCRQPDLQIESDASLIGWGVSCQGAQMGGRCSRGEKNLHINCLELLAATLGRRLHDTVFMAKKDVCSPFRPSVYMQTMKMHTENGDI